MKLSTTLATLATLAVAGWASGPSHPLMPIVVSPAFQGASCPTPAATIPADKKGWKHGAEEYADFTAVTKATGAQKTQLALAFAEKYPDSDYRITALQMAMSAQAATPGQQADAVKTAQELSKSPAADASELLSADVIEAYVVPTITQPNDPEMQTKMNSLLQAATCGEQLAASAPAAQQARFAAILGKAKGYAQLNLKDYDGAIATLTQLTQTDANDAMLYYWMGIAQVTKATPNYDAGIFDLAKASVLAPQTPAISTYLNTVYTSYHGSAEGLENVLNVARSNSAPPADFKIASKVDLENASAMANYQKALAAQQAALLASPSFAGIEARLKNADMSAGEWKKVKGVTYEVTGIVTAVTSKSVDVAVGAKDAATAKADLHVIMAAPFAKTPKVGQTVDVSGKTESFQPNPPDPNTPFLLTMVDGNIAGYSPAPKAGGGQ
ncbi:MAG TPA: hypothetical protein VIE13_13705 [Terriglobales bacterium]|jgi:hypothetical protein